MVLPRVTEGVCAKMASSQIGVAHAVTNEAEMPSATKRMHFSAMARTLADGDVDNVGGAVFRSGAASSSRREEGPQTFPTVATVDAPPLSQRVADSDLPWYLVASLALADPHRPRALPRQRTPQH